MSRIARLTLTALTLLAAGGWHAAQAAPKQAPSAVPVASPAPAENLPINGEQTLYLIRSTLLTLNDANRSGNYTVLRDLAAPEFQTKNSAADLAISFTDLRRRNIDLYAAAVIAPQFTAPPALDERKMLRLSGFFPTRPLHIKFDLIFENSAQHWCLFGISVQTTEAPAQASEPAQAAAPPAPSAARRKTPAAH